MRGRLTWPGSATGRKEQYLLVSNDLQSECDVSQEGAGENSPVRGRSPGKRFSMHRDPMPMNFTSLVR